MKFTIILLISLFVSTNVFANQTSFSKENIIFPLDQSGIEKFLKLMKDPANQKVVNIPEGKVTFKEIPEEKSAIFLLGSESYLLYFGDLNNTGEQVYLLAYINSGSGNYSGIQGAYKVSGPKLNTLNLDSIITKNLFPSGDMSRFHSYLANPFVVKLKSKTYLRFVDNPKSGKVFNYLWHGADFKKIEL